MIDNPPHRGSGGKRCGERNAEALGPEFARERGDQDDARGSRERRPENQRGKRGAERVTGDPSDEGEKRGQIDVAEGEMFGAGEIIQRIAEIAVAHRRGQVQREIDERDEVNPRPQRDARRGAVVVRSGGQEAQE